jgi:hypothetical protein
VVGLLGNGKKKVRTVKEKTSCTFGGNEMNNTCDSCFYSFIVHETRYCRNPRFRGDEASVDVMDKFFCADWKEDDVIIIEE